MDEFMHYMGHVIVGELVGVSVGPCRGSVRHAVAGRGDDRRDLGHGAHHARESEAVMDESREEREELDRIVRDDENDAREQDEAEIALEVVNYRARIDALVNR